MSQGEAGIGDALPSVSRLGSCGNRLALSTGALCAFYTGTGNFLSLAVFNWCYTVTGEHLGLASEECAKAS